MGMREEYTESSPLIMTVENRMKKMVVQELLKSWLYYRITTAGNVINVYDVLEVPFYIAPPQLGKWIRKGDTLPDAMSSTPAMGFWTPRFVVVPSGFDQLEMMQNEGNPGRIFDMADLRSVEVAWALRRTLCSAMWNGTGGKQPDGLTTAIEAAAPGVQAAVVSGVNKATKAWFRNQYVQLTANFGDIGAGTTLPAGILAAMQLIDQCTVGTLVPSDLITTKAVFNMFKRAMLEMSTPYHLITAPDTAKFGFKNFMFENSYLSWDPNCPADKLYALHLQEVFDSDRTGDPRDKTKLDADLEDVPGVNKVFELNGDIGYIVHPNIRRRTIASRSPYRHLLETQWTIDSANLGFKRMQDQGVLGDNGGSKLSTWA